VPKRIPIVAIACLGAALASAQAPDPAFAPLEKAYVALRSKHYDTAIDEFRHTIAIAPDRPSVRKDLAYTLLKTGETEAARDQFAEALRIDPGDDHTALEYAFLCYETKQPLMARRTFDRLRVKRDATEETRATATEAFENIDRPLREGIERWSKAVELSPDNFSAHEELARLFEQHDESVKAAEHFERSWHLRPERRVLLLDLGRAWKDARRNEDAAAALLAASRGGEPRVAEEARELLPSRYPYVYEFQRALALDPLNIELRRELAYLHLEMSNRAEAEREFETLVKQAPDDTAAQGQLRLLRSTGVALRPEPKAAVNPSEAKELGTKSFEKGYLKDALKYLQIAHENDPLDFDVMLKLGWTYNQLKDDREAIRWFDLAKHSPDAKTASAAAKAYDNLHPALEQFRTTMWAFPTFSTRWHDLFAYAQIKTELRWPRLIRAGVHPYVSARFIGDSKGAVDIANLGPQYLSDRSVILAVGMATSPWHGANAWFEAGEMLRYSPSAADPGRAVPDYRGGISFTKGIGGVMARDGRGVFAETNDDGLYVSRFGKDILLYSQNRVGYTLRSTEGFGAFHAQVYWNANLTADAHGEYWANYAETGPGMRFRFEDWPMQLRFSIDALRGAYTINQGNPRGPNFKDVRVGIWYVFSK
jgi:tetratricopeptide (TPR) repeat protein